MIISNFIIKHFMSYIEDSFHQDDLDKVKYSLQVILWETEKIVLLGLIFLYLGKIDYFLTTTIVLISIRAFSGGYHAKTNLACFTISLAMFLVAILFIPTIAFKFKFLIILAVCSFVINLFLAPIPSIQLPKAKIIESVQKKKKICAILITGFWLAVILYNYQNPLTISWLCIIFLQNVQLCVEYVRRKVIKYETAY